MFVFIFISMYTAFYGLLYFDLLLICVLFFRQIQRSFWQYALGLAAFCSILGLVWTFGRPDEWLRAIPYNHQDGPPFPVYALIITILSAIPAWRLLYLRKMQRTRADSIELVFLGVACIIGVIGWLATVIYWVIVSFRL